jgi:hypothetical protein
MSSALRSPRPSQHNLRPELRHAWSDGALLSVRFKFARSATRASANVRLPMGKEPCYCRDGMLESLREPKSSLTHRASLARSPRQTRPTGRQFTPPPRLSATALFARGAPLSLSRSSRGGIGHDRPVLIHGGRRLPRQGHGRLSKAALVCGGALQCEETLRNMSGGGSTPRVPADRARLQGLGRVS